jgi:hypothetical protein
MDACNIDFKPQQKAVLLHLVGEQAREIYYAKAQANDDFDEVKEYYLSISHHKST